MGNESGLIMITTSRRTRVFGISFSAGYFVVARRHNLRKSQVLHVVGKTALRKARQKLGRSYVMKFTHH